jgi:hypothetical protein
MGNATFNTKSCLKGIEKPDDGSAELIILLKTDLGSAIIEGKGVNKIHPHRQSNLTKC